MSISDNQAEIIAIKAIEWLVGDDELLMMFLGSSGAGVDDLKTGAQKTLRFWDQSWISF